jgi:hypothetical protein
MRVQNAWEGNMKLTTRAAERMVPIVVFLATVCVALLILALLMSTGPR